MYCETPKFVESEQASASARMCLRVGDLNLAINGDCDLSPTPELEKFRAPFCAPDITVAVKRVEQLHPSVRKPDFDSGSVWRVSRDNSEFVFDFASSVLGPSPYKQLRTADFVSAEMSLNRRLLPDSAWPLEYPADELLVTNYLARYGLGIEAHGCGLLDSETGGHLFLGHSGAGKSTTTLLWKSQRNPGILSDDRLILRLHHGELWMYGTPWHGEAGFASPAKAKLSRILILQHGDNNRITQFSRSKAVGELFARCFPPFHSPVGLQNTLAFLERIVSLVPCYEFHFVPDASAVEKVLAFHD